MPCTCQRSYANYLTELERTGRKNVQSGLSSDTIFEFVDWTPIEARLSFFCSSSRGELAPPDLTPGGPTRHDLSDVKMAVASEPVPPVLQIFPFRVGTGAGRDGLSGSKAQANASGSSTKASPAMSAAVSVDLPDPFGPATMINRGTALT